MSRPLPTPSFPDTSHSHVYPFFFRSPPIAQPLTTVTEQKKKKRVSDVRLNKRRAPATPRKRQWAPFVPQVPTLEPSTGIFNEDEDQKRKEGMNPSLFQRQCASLLHATAAHSLLRSAPRTTPFQAVRGLLARPGGICGDRRGDTALRARPTPEQPSPMFFEADRKLGFRVSACRQLSLSPSRGNNGGTLCLRRFPPSAAG